MKKLFIKFILYFQKEYRFNLETGKRYNICWKCRFLSLYYNLIGRYKISIVDKKKLFNTPIELKIGEIYTSYEKEDQVEENGEISYKWEELRKSIEKYGVVNTIIVCICGELKKDQKTGKLLKYCVADGNHRLKILKTLYPPTHKIIVNLEYPYKCNECGGDEKKYNYKRNNDIKR